MANVTVTYHSKKGSPEHFTLVESNGSVKQTIRHFKVDSYKRTIAKGNEGVFVDLQGREVSRPEAPRPPKKCDPKKTFFFLLRYILLITPFAILELLLMRYMAKNIQDDSKPNSFANNVLLFLPLVGFHVAHKLLEAYTTILSENVVEDIYASPFLRQRETAPHLTSNAPDPSTSHPKED